jgi:hypothetical protein
LKSN